MGVAGRGSTHSEGILCKRDDAGGEFFARQGVFLGRIATLGVDEGRKALEVKIKKIIIWFWFYGTMTHRGRDLMQHLAARIVPAEMDMQTQWERNCPAACRDL
jgi:hypothetical protein